ncbi:type 4 fimbrial biogenesis protein PilZ (plasmid) [Legionella adelaidensis]|uniref:Type 4 fimbrial biogenesis protein PilZ n=1 Tax=Legionella adelaidensis TaxID=45056 RepID=A0A0W0R512_9GAMM|nr:PilZ domain-containing protein [Legionella adelaidensis]KTC66157.1 type 4 fimbrial biogenesis protein PilZ [Legionella adelaidensis]VEH85669.1 type 4 fimbrial biogenesis protein PilZ [Legionella adelaidensis]
MSDNVITCSFDTEDALYMAYMPFVKGCGLFIRTKVEYSLGDKVSLEIKLFDEPEPYTIEARVVWVTPIGCQGNKPSGIGVQFEGEKSRLLCNKIETYLAGSLNSNRFTDTL